jgi:NADH-ubiquinone oxidoreductase chain 1
MCILTSIFFMGGYLVSYDIISFFDKLNYIWAYTFDIDWISSYENIKFQNVLKNPFMNSLLTGLTLGLKSSILVFVFIWVRASFPRIRFDQLMSFCWTVLLPLLFGFIVLIPCILFQFDAFLINIKML